MIRLLLGCLLACWWVLPVGAFTGATLLDDCNRTEATLTHGGKWTMGVLATQTGVLQANGTVCNRASGTDASAIWADSFGPDVAVSLLATDATSTGTVLMSLYLRLAGTAAARDGYECRFRPSDSSILLREVNASTGSTLQTCPSITIVDGDVLDCVMIGTSLKAYVDGVERCAATDPTITAAGQIGWFTSTNGYSFEDFSACTLSGGVCVTGYAPAARRRAQ